MNSNQKLYETIALGLYFRFRDNKCESCNCYNKENLLENSITFETFVALVMENILGGKAEVTKSHGDGGVDIIHTLSNNEVLLGQVKCYAPLNKIDYEPIAILHSNMVKINAKGGYFVTTSDYNTGAKKHAVGENINLINGFELAQYWLEHKQSWINEHKRKTWLDKFNDEINTIIDTVLRFFKYKI